MKTYVIKEMKANGYNFVESISLVDDPAIEINFDHYKKGEPIPFFRYYADPPVVDNSHEFCKKHADGAGTAVGWYHIDEIRSWSTLSQEEFIKDTAPSYFSNFDGTNFNLDEGIYNCRHKLLRASSLKEVPKKAIDRAISKGYWKKGTDFMINNVEFKIESKEKREITGVVMVSNKMIYRNNIDGEGAGYVYFSKNTVRQLQKDFIGRKASYMHKEELVDSVILMKSWLVENDQTEWHCTYKVLKTIAGEKLWKQITEGSLRGFSIEYRYTQD